MNLKALFQPRSIKTRMTLFTLSIFLTGIWSLAFYGSRMLREDMQRLLGEQQLSTVSILAKEINHELNDHLEVLRQVAADISPAMLGNTAALQALLDQRPLLVRMFNDGVVVVGTDGTAIADAPRATKRIGVNYLDIDTIAATLRDGKSTIGRPLMDNKLRAPGFGMTAPIRDGQGRVIGALGGFTDLGQPSFLNRIIEGRYGKTGGYLLVARQHRLVILATDQHMAMTSLPAPGTIPLVEQFIGGAEVSGIAVNPLGVEILASAQGIPLADWYVAAALPTAEAFAPIRTMQQHMLLAAIFLTLLMGGLLWWSLRHELSPMLAAARTLTDLAEPDHSLQALPIVRQDEIGDLIGAFNRLLATLAQRKTELRESEQRYRAFFEFSPDAILVYRHELVIFANAAAAQLFHASSAAALIGRDWHQLVAPADWPHAEKLMAFLSRAETSQLPSLEQHHLTLDEKIIATEMTSARIVFDGGPAVLAVIRDITERRQTEAQRLADARQQRDTLVREVHHRIKNNLQSVAGLLQRELGKFVELDPRLETAISQVHAIATVHGLQSSAADEVIHLCDSLRNICRTVSDLSQRPVLFDTEAGRTGFDPVWIDRTEAVSVALVLNELVLNAVKHSPPEGAAPVVSLATDGASTRIIIRNALKHMPEFDIASGQGLGTGLRLVRSLLPAQGVELVYAPSPAGYMLTILHLTSPVVVTVSLKEPG